MSAILDSQLKFSLPIPASEVKKLGCFTTLPVRRNIRYKDSDDIEMQVKNRWVELISDGTSEYSHGPINHVSGSWVFLVLPEGNPEILRFVTWFTMFFTMLDDKADRMTRQDAYEKLNLQVDQTISKLIEGTNHETPASPIEKLLAPFLGEFLSHDRQRRLRVMQKWQDWLKNADSVNAEELGTIDEYLNHRCTNIAMKYALISLTTTCSKLMHRVLGHTLSCVLSLHMDLDISPCELQSVQHIQDIAWASVTLTNDYWSWPKEVAFAGGRKSGILNAVCVFMRSGMSETEALETVKQRAIQAEKGFLQRYSDFVSSSPPPTPHLRRFLEAHIWMMSGNSFWSSTCPRYHRDDLDRWEVDAQKLGV